MKKKPFSSGLRDVRSKFSGNGANVILKNFLSQPLLLLPLLQNFYFQNCHEIVLALQTCLCRVNTSSLVLLNNLQNSHLKNFALKTWFWQSQPRFSSQYFHLLSLAGPVGRFSQALIIRTKVPAGLSGLAPESAGMYRV